MASAMAAATAAVARRDEEDATAATEPPPEGSSDAVTAAIAAADISSGGSLADYVIEKAIGRGHFSTVHRAVRRSDERRVALKKVQIFDMLDAKARDRCLKEVQLLKSLAPHQSIIQYIDSFIDNNELFIVFEWAEHGDLRRLLRRANESKTTLQEAQVWRYFVQVTDGIKHMHEARVMHRDIKPANIFLASNGTVKLGDLGLGRAFSSQTYEALSKVGTPLYMSPEVLDGRGYEWKSDIWSLGCLLYELATLRSPFKAEGDNLYTLFKKISVGRFDALPDHYSPQLQKLVASMIQIDPTARPDIHTVSKFAHKALATLTEGGGGSGGGGSSSSAAGGGGEAGTAAAAISDCLVVMEAVGDKLKLLGYERLVRAHGLSPLPCAYFTGADVGSADGVQLEYLFKLVCWLLSVSISPDHQLWSLAPRAGSSTHDADANGACAALLSALRQAPAPLSSFGGMPPHRLRGARGAEVCAMLNALTDAALQRANFVWATPRHVSEAEEVMEEDPGADEAAMAAADANEESDELLDDDDALAVGDDGWGDDEEEAVDIGDAPPSSSVAAGSGDNAADAPRRPRRRRMPVPNATVDGALWHEECERLTPQLVVKLTWQQLTWRHHLQLAQTHAPAVHTAAPAVAAPLEKLASHGQSSLAAIAPLREEHEREQAALNEASARTSEAQKRVDSLATELAELNEAIEVTKQQTATKAAELGGTAPLDRMRAALRSLRAETKALGMKEAMLSQQLEARRAAMAAMQPPRR